VTSSPISSNELIACSHTLFAESTKKYKHSRYSQTATLVLSIASVFVPQQLIVYMLALCAFASQSVAWVLRARASRFHVDGDEARMRSVLFDAFGAAAEPLELNNLLARIGTRMRAAANRELNPDYYASSLPSGATRLRDHLQENCFWSKHLYEAARKQYAGLLAIFVTIAVGAILVAFPLAPRGQSLILAKVIVSVLSFGAALTQLNEILAWRLAANKNEILDRRLDLLARHSENELRMGQLPGLLAVFGDYCVASSLAPPIPQFVYRKERARLNTLWDERTQVVRP